MPIKFPLNKSWMKPRRGRDGDEDKRAAVSELPGRIGLPFNETSLKELDKATKYFLYELDVRKNWPSLNEVRTNLSRVIKRSEDYSEILTMMDKSSHRRLKYSSKKLLDAAKTADAISQAAQSAFGELPKGSRWARRINARRPYIQQLAEIFAEATGKRAKDAFHHNWEPEYYHGDFYKLVIECFAATDQTIHSELALGKEIERSLKEADAERDA